MHNPELELPSRLRGLLRSCDSGLLPSELAKRRRITGYKALWALESLHVLSNAHERLDSSGVFPFEYQSTSDADTDHYSISAKALMHHLTLSNCWTT